MTILASAGIGFTLRGQWVISAVLGWASLAIAVQSSDPTNVAMVERFPSALLQLRALSLPLAGGLAAFLWMFIAARIYILQRDGSDAEDESDNNDNYVKL